LPIGLLSTVLFLAKVTKKSKIFVKTKDLFFLPYQAKKNFPNQAKITKRFEFVQEAKSTPRHRARLILSALLA